MNPVDPSGSSLGWLARSLVVSGLVASPSAAHHWDDLAYCLQETDGENDPESWENVVVLPVPPGEALPDDDFWLTAYRSDPCEYLEETAGMSSAGPSSKHGSHASTEELAALKAEVARINEARAIEQREACELHERLQELERKFDDLLAAQDFDVEEAPVDPHARWIQQNFDELRKYPDMFVALHPERGILVHATEQSEFAAKLETLSPEENERVSLFHTSMYLRG